MLAGEKEKTPEEEEQLEGSEVEEAIVGLEGTTGVVGGQLFWKWDRKKEDEEENGWEEERETGSG